MSFGGGIGQYAEYRSIYADNIEGWINQVHQRMPILVNVGLFRDFNEMDKQFFALSAAMLFGMSFEFEDGKDATGFIDWFILQNHV